MVRQPLLEHFGDLTQLFTNLVEKYGREAEQVRLRVLRLRWLGLPWLDASGGTRAGPSAGLQELPRAFDGVPLLVQQSLDLQYQLDFLAAVEAVPGTRLLGAERGELGLPESQHVGLDTGKAGDLADAEVELVRNFRRRLHGGRAGGLLWRAHDVPLS